MSLYISCHAEISSLSRKVDSKVADKGITAVKALATAALAAPLLIESCVPKTKLRHACIGVGGMMGYNDLQNFVSHPDVEIVAICDVDSNFLKLDELDCFVDLAGCDGVEEVNFVWSILLRTS